MSFPVVASTNSGGNATYSLNHTVTLPSGIVAGDLILVFFVASSSVNDNSVTTFPVGWSYVYRDLPAGSNILKYTLAYRVADGTEGASITVTTSLNKKHCYINYRISKGTFLGVPQAAIAFGTGTTHNPPNLAPSWGLKDTLWLANIQCSGTRTVVTWPINYTDQLYQSIGDLSTGGVTASCRRNLAAISEDPSAFTMSGNTGSCISTVSIEGTSAGGHHTHIGRRLLMG